MAGLACCTSTFAHSDSAHKRHCSAHKRHGSARKQHGSARKRQCSAHRRHCSAHRRHWSAHKRHGSAHRRHGSAHRRGCVRLCLRPPPLCARRRGARWHNGARANPIYTARANYILYIRVRRREGENVLHRAASNDVDNFSVDNPLWITAAAGCRLLRGCRRRRCGGSVNAGTPFRPQDCDFTAWTGRTYIIIYACARSAAANMR